MTDINTGYWKVTGSAYYFEDLDEEAATKIKVLQIVSADDGEDAIDIAAFLTIPRSACGVDYDKTRRYCTARQITLAELEQLEVERDHKMMIETGQPTLFDMEP